MVKRIGLSIGLGLLLVLLSNLLILPILAQGGGQNKKSPTVLNGEVEIDGQDFSQLALKFAQQPGSYKDGPGVVEQNGRITYTLFIKNDEATTATAVLTDRLPASITYVANSLSCLGGAGTCAYDNLNDIVSWNGAISAGESVTVTFAADALPAVCGTVIDNRAVIALENNPVITVSHPTSVWDKVIYYNNFESDNGAFTANTPPGEWAWGVISPTLDSPTAANSGSRVWATVLTGNIPTEPSAHYLSKTLSLPPMVDGRLTWWDWWAEDGLDVGRVLISGTEVYSISANQLEWQNHSLNLTPWSGQNTDIVFYYQAGGGGQGGPGWYLDDVAVVSCDINFEKQAPANIANKSAFTYTLSARHVFTSTLSGVVITDPLPAGTSYVANSATNGASYNSSQNQIEWSGSINPAETISFTFAVSVSAPAGDILINTAAFSRTGQSQVIPATVPSRVFEAANLPVCEGFESGLLPTFMFTKTTATGASHGRARVTNQFPRSGQYAFDLDSSQNNIDQYTRQAGIMAVNLMGQPSAELNFWLMGHGDEGDPADGVFISDDQGVSYTKIYAFPTGSFDYQNISLDLASAASGAGLTLSDNFYIKLQTYDNFTYTDDGYSFDDICIGPPSSDIAVTKTDFPDPVLLGQPVSYTVMIASNGLTDALNVILTDTLPPNINLGSVTASQGSCAGAAPLVCNLGDLTAATTATVSIVITPNQTGIISNSVWASADNELDTNELDNSAMAYTTVLGNNLPPLYGTVYQGNNGLANLYQINPLSGQMTLIGPTGFERVGAIDVNPATGLLYAAAERNDGSNTGVLILLNPDTGAGLEVGPTGLPGNISDISFRNGDSALYAYSAENHELYTLSLEDGSATYVGSTAPVDFLSGNGMAFSVSDSLYHATGESLNSLNPQTGAGTVLYPLSFSPSFTDDTRMSALDFLTDTNTLFGAIKHGYGNVLSSYLAIVELETGVVNNITPTLNGLDGIAFGPAISLTNVADLRIVKSASGVALNAGDSITYTLTISNSGPATATNVLVSDYLPWYFSLDAVFGPGCNAASPVVTCSVGSLSSGATSVITINATTAISALGLISNTAVVSASGVDPTLNNNTAIHTATVFAPRLAVSPTKLTALQQPNTVVTHTLTLSNSGNATATWTLTDVSNAPWLSISALSGSVAGQSQQAINATFDSAGLLNGTYTANLVVSSNAPLNNLITVPVTLSVQITPTAVNWQKTVWVNGAPVDSSAVIPVSPTDTIDIIDRVWLTDTQNTAFILTETFDSLLQLGQTQASIGNVISGTGNVSWQVPSAPPNGWHTLTKTFTVSETAYSSAYVTETLIVGGLSPQSQILQFNLSGPISQPAIIVAPAVISVTLPPNVAFSQTLTITNAGAASLNWNLTINPGVGWLNGAPANGSILPLPATNTQTIALNFDSTGLGGGIYTSNLEISSNDPANSLLTVPVSLTVEACQAMNGLNFSFNPANPTAGQTVDFSAFVNAGNFVSYQWNFGDGATGNGQNISHAFSGALLPVTYTVVLTATNPCSGPLSVSQTVTVEPAKIYLPLLLKNYCTLFNYVGTLRYDMSIINAPQAWSAVSGCLPGSGITVAVVDSGVDLDHSDLQANLVGGATFVDGTSTPDDDNSHGTHVAGIIGAVGNDNRPIGVAPRASIMPVKVLDSSGSGYHSWVAAGITWAVDNGAKVINLSLGGVASSNTLFDAVNYAYNNGALIVASGGNCGDSNYVANGCSSQDQPNYPAAYSNAMAVASTDISDAQSSFSNEGFYIEISAPGSSIYNTFPGGGTGIKSGTSQAAPHVAGLAALIWAETPALTRDQVRAHIRDTAEDLGTSGWDTSYGYGRIDAATALGVTLAQPGLPLAPIALPEPALSGDYAPGRVLLKLDDGITLASVLSAGKNNLTQMQTLAEISALEVYVLSVPVGEEENIAASLAQTPGVVYAEPDYTIQAQ